MTRQGDSDNVGALLTLIMCHSEGSRATRNLRLNKAQASSEISPPTVVEMTQYS